MTIKDNKIKDLAPLQVSFSRGESPTKEKLEGMMNQVDTGFSYLESILGDMFGEDEKYNTYMSSLARDIGNRSLFSPSIIPNQNFMNYQQQLVAGEVEHELDLVPIGELQDIISNSSDSSITPGSYKQTVQELEKPGDWTILPGYSENGKEKRSKKLITHSPSSGGTITLSEVSTGRGSSLEGALENTIPNLAQASDGGPFLEISLVDAATNTYLVTLPLRTKMFDRTGSVIDFSASNLNSGIGLNSQYELPSFFFGQDGLDLDSDDDDSQPKNIPLNLIRIFDWQNKKNVEGIVSIKASPVQISRKYQFLLQMEADVLLDVSTGAYFLSVPGNSISQQLKGLSDAVFNNPGDGQDMLRLISHKNLLGLRTGSLDHSNRSKFYGPSNIMNNDHSMYLHRDGFTDSDNGAGGNVMRGDIVVGNKNLGASDSEHEHFNLNDDSFRVFFGNNNGGGSLFFDKVANHSIPASYGGLPLVWADSSLTVEGAVSQLDPSVKNLFIDAEIRTKGKTVLGSSLNDSIFLQGKTYANGEITFIPKLKSSVTGEAGKQIYDPGEKAMLYHNGASWVNPSQQSGFSVVVGDGVSSFGKYNGTDITPINNAIAELLANGGSIKILKGNYNLLTNTVNIPANISIEGSGALTVVSASNTAFNLLGEKAELSKLTISGASVGVKLSSEGSKISGLNFENCQIGISSLTSVKNASLGTNFIFKNCLKNIEEVFAGSLRAPVERKVGFFPNFSGGVFDHADKDFILKMINTNDGQVVLDDLADSAIGRGCFVFDSSLNADISFGALMPISPNLGIGGHINVRQESGTSEISAGVNMYDKDYNFIGTRWFIVSNLIPTTDPLYSQFNKNIAIGVGSGTNELDSECRFVSPAIGVRNNSGIVHFDNFNIESLSYSRQTTWG